jgi:hypothetical protein
MDQHKKNFVWEGEKSTKFKLKAVSSSFNR